MEKFMKRFLILLTAFCAMLFFVSCGGSTEEKTHGRTDSDEFGDSEENHDSVVEDAEAEDAEVSDSEVSEEETDEEVEEPDDDTAAEVEEPDEPAELAYPEVTATSNKSGDIAQNITIYDDIDVEHKLAEWYQPNNPSSKLIWLIFTAYDCSYCKILKEDLLEINTAEYRDRGLKIVLVFNGLLSGPQPELEPAKLSETKDLYLSVYPDTGRFEIYGYLKKEEQKIFRKFLSNALESAYPTWAFIDASTMEILDHGEGWNYNLVDSARDEIEVLLEIL